jgi:cation diffusion facilitator CzcD-associated flavoprotein CzcO
MTETTRERKYEGFKWAENWWDKRTDDIWCNTNSAPYRFQKCAYRCDCCTYTFRGNDHLKAPYSRLKVDMFYDLNVGWSKMQCKLRKYDRKKDWYDKF